jgi:radical SAM-linked protein
LVLIEFKVRGNLRFLSHAETVRVFQRACVRAGIKVLYSEGFNPRLKLSLPLPRSVGIEVDDDLLCLRVNRDPNEPRVADYESRIKASLSMQLPGGLELLSARVTEAKSAPQPRLAKYVLKVQSKYLDEALKARIKNLLEHKRLNIGRLINTKKLKIENLKSKIRSIDVRPFLKSIELDDTGITVECKISLAGSIRLDEILELLELDYGMLSAPIRRTRVQWQVSES